MPRFAPATDFAKDLRQRGLAYLRMQPRGRFADRGQRARIAGFGALTLALYATMVWGGSGVPAALLALATGISAFLLAAAAAHDAAHGAVFRNGTANRALCFGIFALFGISGQLWAARHVKLHHLFPNVVGTEIDHESTSVLRLSPDAEWRPWHWLQPVYAPFVYMALFPSVAFVEDFQWLRKMRRERPHAFRTWTATAEFAATKIVHCALIVIPAIALDLALWQVVVGYVLAIGVPSLIFSTLVVGTHIAEEVIFPVPDDQDRLATDWATHQMLTSVDWSLDNRFLTVLCGAANTHTAHHLFPEAANCHAFQLNRIVTEMVAKHGAPRNVMSFGAMMRSHLRFLITLARRPAPA